MLTCLIIVKGSNLHGLESSRVMLITGKASNCATIKISCNGKRELYLKARDKNEMEHKLYCKHYCKILSKVIKEAKKLYYKEVITKSKNKMKTTWIITHKETSKLTNENNTKSLRINDHIVYNQITIANELNDYFVNTAGSISNKTMKKKRQVHYKIYLNTLISHSKT